ncbi:MAG: thioredoxin domain-containing protein [Bacteroidia bacterium]|nr:thioredoxin domain-containing protein [Bacteroidia bacterium]
MPNRLAQESSPYLLQHANNPVDWYPWGDEALQKAKDENKLLLVSIGYAACHWCHVMEHECFEDEEVAKAMNDNFVCIKVDREERPDIDKIYMDAVMLMTGRGGWPLNAFATPDGRPVYGGTYYPKEHWMDVLGQLSTLWQSNPPKVEEYASNMVEAMNQMDVIERKNSFGEAKVEDLYSIKATWLEKFDFKWGGRNVQANKFPLPQNNIFLLRAAHFMNDLDLKEAVETSLQKMAFGGIYDHLGGGFARYSVDPYWKVPHFEKMLYDNGQLVSLYSEAYQASGNPLYQRVVSQSIEFVQRELMSDEGAFYSSLDADSEGVEGKFYVWTYEEVEEILGDKIKPFADYFNVHPTGNWEDTNVLFVLDTEENFAKQWKLNPAEFSVEMAEGAMKLFKAREKRVRPGLDDKILASWNGLMLKGLVNAYKAFHRKEYLDLAMKNAAFLQSSMSNGKGLFRNYKNGKASINAFLDDYANLIDGFTALYQVTFDESYLNQAAAWVEHVEVHFLDEHTGLFYYTSDEDPVLVRRKMERQDDVIPSSNATLADSLHQLGLIMDRKDWIERSLSMQNSMRDELIKNPSWHARWGQLMLKQIYPFYEVAITGANAQGFAQQLEGKYHPHKVVAGAEKESDLPLLANRFQDETMIYVCEGYTCQLPVKEVEAAWEQMG